MGRASTAPRGQGLFAKGTSSPAAPRCQLRTSQQRCWRWSHLSLCGLILEIPSPNTEQPPAHVTSHQRIPNLEADALLPTATEPGLCQHHPCFCPRTAAPGQPLAPIPGAPRSHFGPGKAWDAPGAKGGMSALAGEQHPIQPWPGTERGCVPARPCLPSHTQPRCPHGKNNISPGRKPQTDAHTAPLCVPSPGGTTSRALCSKAPHSPYGPPGVCPQTQTHGAVGSLQGTCSKGDTQGCSLGGTGNSQHRGDIPRTAQPDITTAVTLSPN